ncbi:MAG TPA: ABC transporter substrate-binding protein [Xanthobacteraceae bacterium]
MKRREFIAGLASLAAWPRALRAQSARRTRIGLLDTSARVGNANFSAFQQALQALGYVEGQNLDFEYRSADGRNDSFAELANDLARRDVDLIVTRGTPAALAARAATTTIPVVMAAAGDPEAIVRGARPAANLTGFGANLAGAERARVETLKAMLPNVARIAALMNLSNPSRQAEWNAIAAAAQSLGIAPQVLDIRTAADIGRALDAAASAQADAVVIGSDTVMQTNQNLVVTLAAAQRMPAMYTFRDFVDAGGLVSYGVSLPDLYRRAAVYADKILKGAAPRELPVEPPKTAELAVNRKAAKALGLALPASLLARADVVID